MSICFLFFGRCQSKHAQAARRGLHQGWRWALHPLGVGLFVSQVLLGNFTISSYLFISSREPKAQGELIGWESSGRPSVRLTTLSNMNIS